MVVLVIIERSLIMLGNLTNGEYGKFFVQLVLFTPIVGFGSIVSTAIIGTICLVVLFIPYLVIRGLKD